MNVTDFDYYNAGAIEMAKKLLKDSGSGTMSPGPCADAQWEWRKMKAENKRLREYIKANMWVNLADPGHGHMGCFVCGASMYHGGKHYDFCTLPAVLGEKCPAA